MACLSSFECKSCGYKVLANGRGTDSFMMGELSWYVCKECNEVVSLQISPDGEPIEGISNYRRYIRDISPCPNCGIKQKLVYWSSKSKCPKCGCQMLEHGPYCLAD